MDEEERDPGGGGGGRECCSRMDQRLQVQFEEIFVVLESRPVQRKKKYANDANDLKELIALTLSGASFKFGSRGMQSASGLTTVKFAL